MSAFAISGALRQLSCAAVLALGVLACAEAPTSEDPVQATAASLHSSKASEETFTAFESGQVRPLALLPSAKLLLAVNTPDNRLEIFKTNDNHLERKGAVVVGLEPVAVAARSESEVWVVNHLSDSISIVDVSKPEKPVVRRTLLVGDEPRDIVFARGRAYVTTAHRGQNTGHDPQLTTPGVGRADVWVFDPSALGNTLAGTPLTVITLFADTPRALAVSKDQKTVYAAAFHSGNRTMTVDERTVTNSGGLPAPLANYDGVAAPWGSLIVKYRVGGPDGQLHWLDEQNRVWDSHVRFSLPDKDVFAIDATLATPTPKPGNAGAVPGVGTVLFNMAVNPVNGKVYVANLEARNDVRFEGHNASGGTGSVRGHIAESRITVIDGSQVTPRHLNKHIDYAQEGTPAEAAKSLAFPTGMEVSADGRFLYVAALGSSKLGVFKTAELEANTFVPSTANQITLSGGGPTGLVLDPAGRTAFVMTRFDNGISVVDTAAKREVAHLSLYNPEPDSITSGRRFLYDAALTSAHGDSACASCHVFGDFDSLAWDLGDPDGDVLENSGPFLTPAGTEGLTPNHFNPMKGPMTTQSLRGMANHGPMHWRGDRNGGSLGAPNAQPDTGTFDEVAAFKAFNVAFPGLLGRSSQLSDAQMQAFTDFILQVMYPPNPVRNLDNSLTAQQQQGRAFYFAADAAGNEIPSDVFHNCNTCHKLDAAGNAQFGVKKPGFFGTDGQYSFENLPQVFKIAHFRNAYQKVGMFGNAGNIGLPIDRPAPLPPLGAFLPSPLNDESFTGDQVRGFGYLHDGSVDTINRFLGATAFVQTDSSGPFPNPFGIPPTLEGMQLRRALEAFILAFDSNLAPIVGQQITLTSSNASTVNPRIALLLARAAADECDVVVHGTEGDRETGFLYLPVAGTFAQNRSHAQALTEAQLRAKLSKSPLTFTAVPPGSGERIALDRDSDGVLDGDDADCVLAQR